MKLTRHNGRSGKNGVFNPKHNDSNFKIENSEHIDPELAKKDILWTAPRALRQQRCGTARNFLLGLNKSS